MRFRSTTSATWTGSAGSKPGPRTHPGLFVGGNAYHGVAMNDCTEQANVLADRVAGYIGHEFAR